MKRRCEICGRLYDPDGIHGKINLRKIPDRKSYDCGLNDDHAALTACEVCTDKMFGLATELMNGDK